MAESKVAVYGALGANLAIAAIKFTVAGITASSAMLSEAIHSVVDAGNSTLLLVGMKRSQRSATAEHPFGYGKELYFWSLIVAVLIFGAGGGVSAYEGVLHMMNPQPLRDPFWSYIVLAAAAVFESASFVIALRQFEKSRRDGSFWRALRASKDPSTYTVLAEDFAALAGLAAAAIGIYASHRFDMPIIDGAASVVIGVLLAGVAVLLIRESRGLLIGEGIAPETVRAVMEIAQSSPHVCKAGRPLSMYIGADEVLLALDVEFDPQASAEQVAHGVTKIENEIRSRFAKIKRIYIEARPRGATAADAL